MRYKDVLLDYVCSEYWLLAGSCKDCNGPSGSIKGRELLYKISVFENSSHNAVSYIHQYHWYWNFNN